MDVKHNKKKQTLRNPKSGIYIPNRKPIKFGTEKYRFVHRKIKKKNSLQTVKKIKCRKKRFQTVIFYLVEETENYELNIYRNRKNRY